MSEAREIVEDLTGGTIFRLDEQGLTAPRIFKVNGCPFDGVAGSRAAKLVYEAVDHLGRKIPRFAEFHPDFTNMIVTGLDVRASGRSRKNFIAVAYYESLDDIRIFTDASLLTELTSISPKGEDLAVRYDFNQGPSAVPTAGQGFRQLVDVQARFPTTTLIYEKLATKPPYPLLDYIGACNSDDWNGSPAHAWMFANLQIREINHYEQEKLDNKGPWRTRYTFERKRVRLTSDPKKVVQDWRQLLLYRDHSTGQIPPGVQPIAGGYPTQTEGNGWKLSEVQPTAAFISIFAHLPQPMAVQGGSSGAGAGGV